MAMRNTFPTTHNAQLSLTNRTK